MVQASQGFNIGAAVSFLNHLASKTHDELAVLEGAIEANDGKISKLFPNLVPIEKEVDTAVTLFSGILTMIQRFFPEAPITPIEPKPLASVTPV